MFNHYIDGLITETNKLGTTIAYADDIAIIIDKKIHVKETINIIMKWCERNQMCINKLKSGIMKVKQKSYKKKKVIFIEGVPEVIQYKFLGVELTNSLRLRPHIDMIKDKLEKFMKLGS